MTLQELVDVIKTKRGWQSLEVGGWLVMIEDADTSDLVHVAGASFDDDLKVLVLLGGPKP